MCVQVVFTNEQSGEYQYYELQYRAVRPGVMATVRLSTTVRQRRQHSLTVDNPLSTAAHFATSCTVADLIVPAQISVAAQSQVLLSQDKPSRLRRSYVRPSYLSSNYILLVSCLQCFDAVGWAAGRASGL